MPDSTVRDVRVRLPDEYAFEDWLFRMEGLAADEQNKPVLLPSSYPTPQVGAFICT
ncbi:hypothetical protein AB0D63_44435 [Kitasatospora sp. NPDC048343]